VVRSGGGEDDPESLRGCPLGDTLAEVTGDVPEFARHRLGPDEVDALDGVLVAGDTRWPVERPGGRESWRGGGLDGLVLEPEVAVRGEGAFGPAVDARRVLVGRDLRDERDGRPGVGEALDEATFERREQREAAEDDRVDAREEIVEWRVGLDDVVVALCSETVRRVVAEDGLAGVGERLVNGRGRLRLQVEPFGFEPSADRLRREEVCELEQREEVLDLRAEPTSGEVGRVERVRRVLEFLDGKFDESVTERLVDVRGTADVALAFVAVADDRVEALGGKRGPRAVLAPAVTGPVFVVVRSTEIEETVRGVTDRLGKGVERRAFEESVTGAGECAACHWISKGVGRAA